VDWRKKNPADVIALCEYGEHWDSNANKDCEAREAIEGGRCEDTNWTAGGHEVERFVNYVLVWSCYLQHRGCISIDYDSATLSNVISSSWVTSSRHCLSCHSCGSRSVEDPLRARKKQLLPNCFRTLVSDRSLSTLVVQCGKRKSNFINIRWQVSSSRMTISNFALSSLRRLILIIRSIQDWLKNAQCWSEHSIFRDWSRQHYRAQVIDSA
jgi:hypothetical protein